MSRFVVSTVTIVACVAALVAASVLSPPEATGPARGAGEPRAGQPARQEREGARSEVARPAPRSPTRVVQDPNVAPEAEPDDRPPAQSAAVEYHEGRRNAFFDPGEFRQRLREASPELLRGLRSALLDAGTLDELPAGTQFARDTPSAVTDRMAMIDLLGDLADEDEDAVAALIEVIKAPIDVRKPEHVKRVLLVEKYEALSLLANKDWKRAQGVFAELRGEGIKEVLRPAMIEGLAAAGVPYEQAAAMAAEV